jgi:2-oxoglutarate dehydrogenase complex dehydrogenase (E1) component-like enzyme
LSSQTAQTDFSEIIAENFGANATYVEGLLERFRSDPALVDDAWRAYFVELLGGAAQAPAGNGGASATGAQGDGAQARGSATRSAGQPTAQPAPNAATPDATADADGATARQPVSQAPAPRAAAQATAQAARPAGEAQAIRGAALKIVRTWRRASPSRPRPRTGRFPSKSSKRTGQSSTAT